MSARVDSPYYFDSPVAALAADLATVAANAGAVLARCTLYPWMVVVTYRDAAGNVAMVRQVVEGLLSEPPCATGYVPDGAEFMRGDVFPATRFDDMTPETRARYKAEYRDYLMWRKAKAYGKTVVQLVPWVDYDAVMLDESVERWVMPFARWSEE